MHSLRILQNICRFPELGASKHLSTTTAVYSDKQSVVLVEKHLVAPGLVKIAINRPEKRNCINFEVAEKLSEAIQDFESDPDSTVAVLYGVGGTFCAGYDLAQVAEQCGNYDLSSLKEGHGWLGPSRRFIKKPLVAAVDGHAVAGGLELALMCDVRIVEENAIMGVYCRRFGVPLIDGGTVRLPHLIGLSRAMDLILSGRGVSGKEALDYGLANRLVAVGTAVGQAVNFARSLLKFPQECMNRDRKSAHNAMYNATSFDRAVDYELKHGFEIFEKESVPGAAKFVKGVGRHGSFAIEGPVPVKVNLDEIN